MNYVKYFLIVALLLPLSGCDWFRDPLVKAINERWPPVDKLEQQRKSILDSSRALSNLGEPDIYASVSTILIESALRSAVSDNKLGVSLASVETENQFVTVELTFKHRFEGGIPAVILGKASGSISFSIVEDESKKNPNSADLVISILPALNSIRVEEIKLEGDSDLNAVIDPINSTLNEYLDNLNGYISRRPEMKIIVPVPLPDPINPQFESTEGINVSYNSAPMLVPSVKVEGAPILITKRGIEILAQLKIGDSISKKRARDIGPRKDFSSFKKDFDLVRAQAFAENTGSDIVLTVNKRTLSQLLQSMLRPGEDSKLCLSMKAQENVHSFNEKIGIPDETTIDCTPTRDCSATHIDCTPTRDCTPRKDCGGYKWYQAPDKLRCEAEKSAAKLDCERIKSTNKAKCEANKSAWKLDCERIKSQQKAACEVEKELVKRLSRTGNFANIDGTATVNASLGACFGSIELSEDLNNLSLTLEFSGTADVATHMKFTPLDIVGHLACQVPWSDRFFLTTTIPEQSVKLAATFSTITSGEDLHLAVSANGFTVNASMEPSPKQELLNSNNFNISCLPLSGLIRAVDIFAGDVIPDEVNGKIVHEQDPFSFKWPIKPIRLSKENIDTLIKVSIDEKSISLYGQLER
ncbi:MAG: hypothetical protein AB2817_07070 [Candidatus Thiodiazotropha sp.]